MSNKKYNFDFTYIDTQLKNRRSLRDISRVDYQCNVGTIINAINNNNMETYTGLRRKQHGK